MNKSEAIDIMRNLQAMIVSPNKQDKEAVFAIQMGIDALKAQGPHVMTPEEVKKVGQGDIIWEELRCNNECIPLVRERNDFYFPNKAYLYLGEIIDCDDYGRNYRCWTSRPTDEQRKAVKWG